MYSIGFRFFFTSVSIIYIFIMTNVSCWLPAFPHPKLLLFLYKSVMNGDDCISSHTPASQKISDMSINSIRPFAFCLSFLPLLISMAADTISPYSPTNYFLLDCGSSSNTTLSSDGRTWRGDSASKFSSSNTQNVSLESTAASVEQVPYMTARIFTSQFTYTFPVSAGPKFVRFYFYPAAYSGIHESDFFFNVTSGVYTVMSNFSASLTVAAMEPQVASIVKEFIIHVWENQTLNITFSPSPSFYAFMNGIELCSMPNNLYISDSEPIPLVATNYLFYIDIYTALETVYRLNVDGASFGGERETGMFRTWQQDSSYIFGAASGLTLQGNNTDIRYTRATPAHTAPTAVDSSCRSMGPIPDINLNYNLTWIFPVDSGFYYLVRLHFCEIGNVGTPPSENMWHASCSDTWHASYSDTGHPHPDLPIKHTWRTFYIRTASRKSKRSLQSIDIRTASINASAPQYIRITNMGHPDIIVRIID